MKDIANLARTAAAIDAYDVYVEGPEYQADPAGKAIRKSEELARAVGEAFGHDTADRNNFENCAELVRPGSRVPPGGDADLSFVRRAVATWKESTQQ